MASRVVLRSAALAAVVLSVASTPVVKIGGHIQSSYKPAFDLWVTWAKTQTSYTVDTTNLKEYESSTMASDIAKMTDSADAMYSHVIICPYTSGLSITCASAVKTAYTGAVMIWGGASDSIFSTNCAALPNKNCFGFFTVASKYTEAGLVGLATKGAAKVATIVNNNGFSASVLAGAKTTITAQSALTLDSETQISVAKTALASADKTNIAAAMAKTPDIVVIAGHNLDVEPVIVEIGKGTHWPKAILATNGLTNMANYGVNVMYSSGVMMPTQWDSSDTTAKDPVVGWTSSAFTTAMGGTATYQQAAAGAVGVAIANALAANPDPTTIKASLSALNVQSFYGTLNWDATGIIQKPMSTMQKQGSSMPIMKDSTAVSSTAKYPLTSSDCWGKFHIKIGGHVQDSYVSPFNLWAGWAGKAAVTTSFKTYDSNTMAGDVTKMTTAGDATYVDALVCPYGSTAVKACVDAVNKAYTGPVFAWGGAADAIFDTNCAALTNKNCFGFFTIATQYTQSGLAALNSKVMDGGKVASIVNNNAFSLSVATGTKATVAAQSALTLDSETQISVAKAALTDADKSLVKAAMAKKPEVVVIAGHNLDVEPIIMEIGMGTHYPHAILATNGLTQMGNYGSNYKFATGVMMPTQWDETAATKDPVVMWDVAAFKSAMGGSATYQQAAAGAVGVAISNALYATPDTSALKTTLQSMDVDSFYGKLKWDATGKIQKPMYTQQKQGTSSTVTQLIVAPSSPSTTAMQYPLLLEACWGSWVTKIGGQIQDSYRAPMTFWADSFANKASVTTSLAMLQKYDSGTMAAQITKMTTPGDDMYVDALVCPYGSAVVKLCVDAVNKAYTGPVFAWGGAADSIFDTNCAALPNKNCFGFFTVATQYTQSGLVALAAKGTAKVVSIVNNNAFSESVAAGTNTTIGAQTALTLHSYTKISVSKAALTTADKAAISSAIASNPDIVVIAGHNLDVEPVIVEIGTAKTPKAILATNGLTSLANYGINRKYATCVMMPTQWDSTATTKDDVVGWTPAQFTDALAGLSPSITATYQLAASGAVGVAISNALAIESDKTKLRATLSGMDKDSFYGRLKWDIKGKIQKPMYTMQLQGTSQVLAAPTGTMKYPLDHADCWGGAATGDSNSVSTTSGAWSQIPSMCVLFGLLMALVSQ